MDEVAQSELVNAALNEGERRRAGDGTYVRWAVKDGVELWLQLDRNGDVVGLNPHFSGPTKRRVRIISHVRREGESPFDGGFHAWADPTDSEPESGQYPFVFDVPDYVYYADLDTPTDTDIQLAAFAQDLETFESEAAFHAKQATASLKYATQSFIPVGLFPDSEGATRRSAYAQFTGVVREMSERSNSFSGGSFIWARVETLGGEVDVVIDPESLPNGLQVGSVIQGTFWLSGKLPNELAVASEASWKRFMQKLGLR